MRPKIRAVVSRLAAITLASVAVAPGATAHAVATAAHPKAVPPGEIETFAGGGRCEGDVHAATTCLRPSGVATGPNGDVYVSDLFTVRRLSADGTITVVAGNGNPNFCGDGGPARDACLSNPNAVAVHDGRLYITDTGNNRIRVVDRSRTIDTLAGSGTQGFCGDGGPALGACFNGPDGIVVDPGGSVYVVDSLNSRVRVIGGT